jgi:hypothetical protein
MSAVWKRVPNDIQAFGLLRRVGIGARNGFSPSPYAGGLRNEDRTVAGSK